METKLHWYRANRKKLPGLLVGVERPDSPPSDRLEMTDVGMADAMVGYSSEIPFSDLMPPNVVVIEDSRVRELLAWLHTYSEESFPISHYCRVQALSDWRLTADLPSKSALRPTVASLIVGEMLAQAESDLNLSRVPLSWASGCFTLAMHRALVTSGPMRDQLTKLAAERLRYCESDARFAKRSVSVDALTPMWALLTEAPSMRSSVYDVCSTVLAAMSRDASQVFESNEALRSNSAETRVRGFDAVADQGMALAKAGKQPQQAVSCLLAAAALQVGGGTSHIELLRPLLTEVPASPGWFGLMAGFAGPSAWDPAWLRLVKGVERQLGMLALSPNTAGEADLAWVEYQWLASQSENESMFVGFPKRHQKTLTVEVLPGAPCQFRLQDRSERLSLSADTSALTNQESGPVAHDEGRDEGSEDSSRWKRIRDMASELAQLIEGTRLRTISDDAQKALFSPDPVVTRKSSRNRGKSTSRR